MASVIDCAPRFVYGNNLPKLHYFAILTKDFFM